MLINAGWRSEWGFLPLIVGPDNQFGFTPGFIAAATGFRAEVIRRHMEREETPTFTGRTWKEEDSPEVEAVDVATLAFLLIRLTPGYLKDPRKRLGMRAILDLTWKVHEALSETPEMKAATRQWIASMGLQAYDELGNPIELPESRRVLN